MQGKVRGGVLGPHNRQHVTVVEKRRWCQRPPGRLRSCIGRPTDEGPGGPEAHWERRGSKKEEHRGSDEEEEHRGSKTRRGAKGNQCEGAQQ